MVRVRAVPLAEAAIFGGSIGMAIHGLNPSASVNASLDEDGETVVLKHCCHIGVAVASDRALPVPVVHHIERKLTVELTVGLTGVCRRASTPPTPCPRPSARPPSDFSGAPRTCPRAPSSQQQTEEAST